MANNDVNYQALANEPNNPFIDKSSQQHEIGIDETTTDTENEDGNRDNGIMIHVVPDTSKGELLVAFEIFYSFYRKIL